MATHQRRGSSFTVKFKPSKLPKELQEIGGLGQEQREFAVWAWLREKEEQQQAESDPDLKRILKEKGVSFSNEAYFGRKASNAEAVALRKRRLSMERRGFYVMYPRTPTGRHTTHFSLTEKGRRAGEFYYQHGLWSPLEVEDAINASTTLFERQLRWLNEDIEVTYQGLGESSREGDVEAFNATLQKLRELRDEALKVKDGIEGIRHTLWLHLESLNPEMTRQTLNMLRDEEARPSLLSRLFHRPPEVEFTDGGPEPWPPLPEEAEEEPLNEQPSL